MAQNSVITRQVSERTGQVLTDHIAKLHIGVEQSLELNSSLCVSLIDYKKAFDSIDWDPLETAWSLWSHPEEDHLSFTV